MTVKQWRTQNKGMSVGLTGSKFYPTKPSENYTDEEVRQYILLLATRKRDALISKWQKADSSPFKAYILGRLNHL